MDETIDTKEYEVRHDSLNSDPPPVAACNVEHDNENNAADDDNDNVVDDNAVDDNAVDDSEVEDDVIPVRERPGICRMNEERKLKNIPRVMFSSMEDVHAVEEPNDDESKERWYSDGEYVLFKRDFINTVQNGEISGFAVSSGGAESSVGALSRIEESSLNEIVNPTPKSYQERGTRVKAGVQTVLDAQKIATARASINNKSGIPIPSLARTDSVTRNRVAMKYHDAAYEANRDATSRAAECQKEVNEYLRDVRPEEKVTVTEPKTAQQPTNPKGRIGPRFGNLLGR
jgi:hypothetical protein